MDIAILHTIFYASLITIIIPLILLTISINRQPGHFIWLTVFLSFSFMCDIAGRLLLHNGINPNYAGHAYQLGNIALISVFFHYIINWTKLKACLLVGNILYFAFAVFNVAFLQKAQVNSYTQVLQSIIILILCIWFFYKLLRELPTQQIQKLPLFWIASALFFTYSGKLVVYAVAHYLSHVLKDNLIILWSLHNLLSVIGNLLIAWGTWLQLKKLNVVKTQ